mmetsp:Transcript_20717/g.79447  ORF Transcript_20717/g.79447 Transcript_20717/m.79447 type:complete len:207 (+) Transcript_20717:19-639(+)
MRGSFVVAAVAAVALLSATVSAVALTPCSNEGALPACGGESEAYRCYAKGASVHRSQPRCLSSYMAAQCSSVRAELGMAEFFRDTWKMYYIDVDLDENSTCNITSLFVRAFDQDDTTSAFVQVAGNFGCATNSTELAWEGTATQTMVQGSMRTVQDLTLAYETVQPLGNGEFYFYVHNTANSSRQISWEIGSCTQPSEGGGFSGPP